nr:immunoglobulin heavy chain junction region [Mus musculus]
SVQDRYLTMLWTT